MTVTMALGLKFEEDDTMSDYSSISEGQIEEDAKFSQAMVGEPLSPAKTTKQEKLTRQKSRAASRSNTDVARKIFDYYYLDGGSPYYHGLCKEMVVPFALRYGMDTYGRQEILLAKENKEFPPIEDWIKPLIDPRIWPNKEIWEPEGDKSEPPCGLEKEKPIDKTMFLAENTKKLMNSVSALVEMQQQQRKAVVFHRGLLHVAIAPNLVAECKNGSDLLKKALVAARVTNSRVLRPNRAIRRSIRDGTMQALYDFDDVDYRTQWTSDEFKLAPIGSILFSGDPVVHIGYLIVDDEADEYSDFDTDDEDDEGHL